MNLFIKRHYPRLKEGTLYIQETVELNVFYGRKRIQGLHLNMVNDTSSRDLRGEDFTQLPS